MFKNTQIYTFPNSERQADPLDLRRKLIIHTKGELKKLIEMYNDGTEFDKAVAEETLIQAARLAFGLLPVTEPNGFGDATVLEYLAHFLEWLSNPPVTNINSQPKSRPCAGC